MSDVGKQKPSRLGRGLSSLIGEVEAIEPVGPSPGEPSHAPTGTDIALESIRPNPAQPRQVFEPKALDELAESIRQRGVLQPILVRPDPKSPATYQIVAGERRWRAARKAGLKAIPAVVRDTDELELLELGIIENVQRTDLNPMEEAEAYEALRKRFGRTQESLAESVGKSRSHIANALRLLNLPESVRDLVRNGDLSAGHARAVLASNSPENLAETIVSKGLSVREAEALAKKGDEDTQDIRKAIAGAASEKDVDTKALESDLMRTLGLEVDIRHGPKGGELRIKYRDLEQLDDVCRKLTAKRG